MIRAAQDMGIFFRKLANLTGADCFVLALDRLMHRHKQQGLIGQTHLLLESTPELAGLRIAAENLARKHPLLDAVVKRNPFTFQASWHIEKNRKSHLPVLLWREPGAGSHPEAQEVPCFKAFSEDILNQSLQKGPGLRNLRLDLVFLGSGQTVMVLTWSHLLFDGKGAELLLAELINSATNATPSKTFVPGQTPTLLPPIRERMQLAKPVVEHFFNLARNNYRSLAGPHPRPGRLRFRLLQLDPQQSGRVKEYSAQLAGSLFNVSFYLACAVRAHRAAFLCRGGDPTHYVVSIPVQVRRKGGPRNPFHNSVTVLFFCLQREDLGSLQAAVASAQRQFEEMTRSGLDRAFTMVLSMMSVLPSYPYMKFVENQFSGEVSSFFHSFTGSFAVEPECFFGARVQNAYHIPSISSPPGSGLFFGNFRGQLSATFSWREGAVSGREIDAMMAQLREDFRLPPQDHES